jgi:2-C-methyl-D-erythritol 4-phosphate cytidylyltransferase
VSAPVAAKFWGVVPAAGAGTRMGQGSTPKQYLKLEGRAIIEWSVSALLEHAGCCGVIVCLAPDDRYWSQLPLAGDARIVQVVGGSQRSHSVNAGLQALASRVTEDDWVVVHDAARPCVSPAELRDLVNGVLGDPVGGLLAAPVIDTLKRADAHGRVAATVSREHLWRALTPQMFRFGLLQRALRQAAAENIAVTDEAQAVEGLGLQPRLIAGSADNIKMTLPEDLERAERILAGRRGSKGQGS